jgi:hypothetical protein
MEEDMKRLIVAVAVFIILAAGSALAATPVGQWNLRGFDGPDHVPGPLQGICFVVDGTWYSTTFTGWNGQWTQNGDSIRFYGTTGVLSTAELGQFISNTRISGGFVHFKTSPKVVENSIGNFFATRTSLTCDVAAAVPDYSVAGGDPAIK